MKTLIITAAATIGSCWIVASIKDVERVTNESVYYSDVTFRLQQAVESIRADMDAGETERMKKKIEILHNAVRELPMTFTDVSLHEMAEAFYKLDYLED